MIVGTLGVNDRVKPVLTDCTVLKVLTQTEMLAKIKAQGMKASFLRRSTVTDKAKANQRRSLFKLLAFALSFST